MDRVRIGIGVTAFLLVIYAFYIGVNFVFEGLRDIGFALVISSIQLASYLVKDIFGSSKDKVEIAAPANYTIRVNARVNED